MSLDVRDSFLIPYHLLNPYSIPAQSSNSKCLDNLTAPHTTLFSNAPVVPIVRHLTVKQIDDEQRTNETTKTSDVPIPGSSVISKYSIKVIWFVILVVVCVTVSLILRRRKP